MIDSIVMFCLALLMLIVFVFNIKGLLRAVKWMFFVGIIVMVILKM